MNKKNIIRFIFLMMAFLYINALFQSVANAQTTEKRLPPPDFRPGPSNHPRVIGWPNGPTPIAPPGFTVSIFAGGFENSRWLYVLPNGDVLVSEADQPPKPEDLAEPAKLRQLSEAGIRGPSPNRIKIFIKPD